MQYIVDRIEEEFVVLSCEGGEMMNVPLCETENVCEGDILDFNGERYILLKSETTERKKTLAERFEKLKTGDKK